MLRLSSRRHNTLKTFAGTALLALRLVLTCRVLPGTFGSVAACPLSQFLLGSSSSLNGAAVLKRLAEVFMRLSSTEVSSRLVHSDKKNLSSAEQLNRAAPSPVKMYGLYLEAVNDYINESYGEDVWRLIENRAEIPHLKFVRHQMYNDNLILRLAKAAGEVLGKTHDELMYAFGVYMVKRIGNYGYERILKVLGRNVRDFINELDNLHEYFRFSFPKVQPPSFCVEEECETSLTLHYRSTRKGFTQFVKGQLSQVGRQFYNTDIEVEILSKEETEKMTYVVYKMNFDNAAFKHRMPQQKTAPSYEKLPMKRGIFFDMFPFSVIFRRNMTMYRVGDGLKEVFSDLQGKKVNEEFTLVRPMLEFSWDNIYTHLNNVFELMSEAVVESKQKVNIPKLNKEEPEEKEESEKAKREEEREKKSVEEIKGTDQEYSSTLTQYNSSANSGGEDIELLAFQTVTGKCSETIFEDMREPPKKPLHLKGQMKYVPQWDSLIFLGTPIIETVEDMIKMGVYVNDLNLHDSSRELILAGTQQSAELQLALDQEQQKYAQLQEIIKKLDEEKKRGDSLLYAMIPKAVADRLRKGITALETCQVFPDVTILFSDVVKFNEICIHITPMQVVDMLNEIYIVFDTLSEKHNVYKVETIRDAYMVVAGVPNKTTFHAHHICDMALDMLSSIDHLKDPSTGDNIQIRVGVHSGMVVAGVVGLKMPRYCLFGDTVNTASRMESNGVGMQIHISQTTKDHLEHEPYSIEERGKIFVKGKGYMKTYWLKGKKTPAELRYISEQKDLEDKSSNGSTSTCAKRSDSCVLTSGGEEQAEGKTSPGDLPPDAVPLPEVATEPLNTSDELQEKEKSKKTKNNKGAKLDAVQGNPMSELMPPTDELENLGAFLQNKRNSFRQQYAKLPTNLPIRSASCTLL
ncbi:soluble guanylate cyclase 88E-like [Entelurus aequoreus]|uniref:soluble guanylate cyclase 88E-like n=1 Tax=Entelurus aequoreus TaxID=161455 RepID=UPI002B1E3D74|nr:soluble guanylate cyclase 88E-like [Entelurus aequoreus]